MKKKDIVFILVLLAAALGSWVGLKAYQSVSVSRMPQEASPEGETVPGQEPENPEIPVEEPDLGAYGTIRISVSGNYFGTYSLGEDQVIEIGDTNVVEIADGEANMIHAECPDQLCTYMGPITGAYGLIVCLPNAVVIEGFAPEGKTDTVDIDGIS